MSTIKGSLNRQLVPSWRTWDVHVKDAEDVAATNIIPSDPALLNFQISEYQEKPNVGRASELISTAIVTNQISDSIVEISREILSQRIESPILFEVASQIVSGRRSNSHQGELPAPQTQTIASLRRNLKFSPRNAIRWADLSRLYLTIGELGKANRAMAVALQLSPNHIYILRANSTLLWQQGLLDKAVDILNSRERSISDPRLLAPLIALSDLSKSRIPSIRNGMKVISDGNFSKNQTSELLAAIATLEIANGSVKKGVKLFRQGLEAPTDNVLAQAIWLSDEKKIHIIDEIPQDIKHVYEAASRQLALRLEWPAAVVEAKGWIADQPYSTQAATHGSWSASEARDWPTGIDFAEKGLKINPLDPILLNNHAYLLIQNGNPSAAKSFLEDAKKVSTDNLVSGVITATEGLFSFRSGDAARGRLLYLNSIDQFITKQSWSRALDASIRLAIEELRIRSAYSEEAVRRVYALASKSTDLRVKRHLEWMEELV